MTLDWKKTSQWWYGRFRVDGRIRLQNLNVKIDGERPSSISATGPGVDPAFIKSRDEAWKAHAEFEKKLKEPRNEAVLYEKVLEFKRGTAVDFVKLVDLPDRWASLDRKRPLSVKYEQHGRKTLQRFVDYIQHNNRDIVDLVQLTKSHVKNFMDSEDARGVTPRTWNFTFTLLKGALSKLARDCRALDYFNITPLRELTTVSRRPFTEDELRAILDAAAKRKHEYIQPVIVTGAFSAMRLGDCCRLTWSSVDLDENFITATTHKTGKSVEIPILPELRAELLQHVDNGSQYCFPGPADMYESNPDGIQRRIGLVLKDAGFSREDCTQERRGLKRANVLGFHALRTTGATRLLAAGVPPETVIKITGHTSVKTLMDHYDQRSMRQRRAVIREAMEKAAGQQNKRESKEKRLREILADMKPKRLRDEALKILDGDF